MKTHYETDASGSAFSPPESSEPMSARIVIPAEPLSTRQRNTCVAALTRSRLAMAHVLREQALPMTDRWQREIASFGTDLDGFVERHLTALVDYLTRFIELKDETYRDLASGEVVNICSEIWLADSETAVELAGQGGDGHAFALTVVNVMARTLSSEVGVQLASQVEEELQSFAQTFSVPATKTVTALLVGDCLFVDILPFWVVECRKAGLALAPTILSSKNQAAIRANLGKLADRKYDLIAFSPFSYAYSPEYAQLLYWKGALKSRSAIKELVERCCAENDKTMDALCETFACSVLVHNSANIVRDENRGRQILKNVLTAPVRHYASSLVDAWLHDSVARRQSRGSGRVVVFDERRLVAEHGELRLGRYLHVGSSLQHPALFGKFAARNYRDIACVQAFLRSKKLIICDLDNTLWDGVIGEGSVKHFTKRQQLLLTLKQHGLLLAINSKNDPQRVHFRGAVLVEKDFVASCINWSPKSRNTSSLLAELNIKAKDAIFIDDRRDEREMMRQAHPDILTLDATDESIWRLLEVWTDFAEDSLEGDRTRMYHERADRQKFIQEKTKENQAQEQAAIVSLGMKIQIRSATAGELPRVTDLINRTNQFNLSGSRTDLKQVKGWHSSQEHEVLVVECADKFGDMGIISALILERKGSRLCILIYVLSCRVFGYGIETSTLAAISQHARRLSGVSGLTGWYKATPHNSPCRDLYASHGFKDCGTHWESDLQTAPSHPDWLTVRDLLGKSENSSFPST